MSWNYRVIKKEDYLEIHEVYYDKKGKPNGYTENAVTVGGEFRSVKMGFRNDE